MKALRKILRGFVDSKENKAGVKRELLDTVKAEPFLNISRNSQYVQLVK